MSWSASALIGSGYSISLHWAQYLSLYAFNHGIHDSNAEKRAEIHFPGTEAGYDAHFTQFSGAIWWPMVYDLPEAAKREFARRKRIGQEDRAMRYIREVGAPNIFPTAGPP